MNLCTELKNILSNYLLTYSMVQNPSWEANWFAASQEIPRISRNPNVHYCTHKSPPPVSILGQHNPVHIPTSHLLEINPNIIHPSTPRSPQWSPSLWFPHQDPIQPPLLTHTRHMPWLTTLNSMTWITLPLQWLRTPLWKTAAIFCLVDVKSITVAQSIWHSFPHFIQYPSTGCSAECLRVPNNDLNITYENTSITTVKETKFLGLNINNTLSWTTHIDKIIPKLCSACFALRSVRLLYPNRCYEWFIFPIFIP